MPAPSLAPPIPDRLVDHPAYQGALEWIFGFSPTARPSAEIVADRPRKLLRMRGLLKCLDNPERTFESVLVAGTKGKGSTAAMLDAMARSAGLATGLYTQPHLHTWRERTRIGGQPIEPDRVVALMPDVRRAVDSLQRDHPELGPPTTFEVGTAFTLLAFARSGVRLAIVEVGVGGAHDATNALEPRLVALAPISLDHVATLGGSIQSIAEEKAGLFRENGLALVGPQPPEAMEVVERIAHERRTTLELVGREWGWHPEDERAACGSFRIDGPGVQLEGLAMPLLGQHQRDNATLATAAGHALGLEAGAIRQGLATVSWPARLQVLRERPWIVVDGAHNGESARCLIRALLDCFDFHRLHLILGLSEGKDIHGILDALLPASDRLTLTTTRHYRALPIRALAAEVHTYRRPRPHCEPDISKALRYAQSHARPDDLICVTGSLFLAAEAIEAAGDRSWELGVGGR